MGMNYSEATVTLKTPLKILGVLLYLFGIVITLTALIMLVEFLIEKPIGLPCPVVTHDGALHIEHGVVTADYLVAEKDSWLLYANGRHPTGPASPIWLKDIPEGAPLHIEMCGKWIVRFNSNDRKIFEQTQDLANLRRAQGIKMAVSAALIASLAALFGRFLTRRKS
jgi:hypothetical protein